MLLSLTIISFQFDKNIIFWAVRQVCSIAQIWKILYSGQLDKSVQSPKYEKSYILLGVSSAFPTGNFERVILRRLSITLLYYSYRWVIVGWASHVIVCYVIVMDLGYHCWGPYKDESHKVFRQSDSYGPDGHEYIRHHVTSPPRGEIRI